MAIGPVASSISPSCQTLDFYQGGKKPELGSRMVIGTPTVAVADVMDVPPFLLAPSDRQGVASHRRQGREGKPSLLSGDGPQKQLRPIRMREPSGGS